MNPTCPFDLVIGLDRSDRKAELYLIHAASAKTEQQTIGTSPEALHRSLPRQSSASLCVLMLDPLAPCRVFEIPIHRDLFVRSMVKVRTFLVNPLLSHFHLCTCKFLSKIKMSQMSQMFWAVRAKGPDQIGVEPALLVCSGSSATCSGFVADVFAKSLTFNVNVAV